MQSPQLGALLGGSLQQLGELPGRGSQQLGTLLGRWGRSQQLGTLLGGSSQQSPGLISFPPQVLEDSKKWWKVQNRYGQTGYVPYNILAPALGPGFPGAHNYNGVAPANGNSSAGSSSGQGIFRSLVSRGCWLGWAGVRGLV